MDKAKQRSYTSEERASVLKRVEEISIRAAAEEFGIPQGTISSWRFYAGKKAITGHSAEVEVAPVPASHESLPRPDAIRPTKALSKRVAKVYTPSQRAEILEHAAKHGPTEAARRFGTTRFSIYSWQRQAKLHAQGKAKSSPLAGSDEDTATVRDQRILKEWKAHPGLGPISRLYSTAFQVANEILARELVGDHCQGKTKPTYIGLG